jgi:choline dehydrogenase-like flavoprotein
VLGAVASVFEGPVGTALEGTPGFGRAHRELLARRFGATLGLLGIAEQLPRAENRVVLGEGRDRFGVPLARVETRLDAGDLAALRLAWRRLGQLAEAAGVAHEPGQVTAYDQPNASHVAGTCRMGNAPEQSVVDRFGALHGRPELVVADASVLVTEGAGDSPSLTLQALALRAAEALAARARRGEV